MMRLQAQESYRFTTPEATEVGLRDLFSRLSGVRILGPFRASFKRTFIPLFIIQPYSLCVAFWHSFQLCASRLVGMQEHSL